MLNIYCADYSAVDYNKLKELFILRKNVFHDRLKWAVDCTGDMELDSFDDFNAKYIYGVKDGKIICGSRILEMNNRNMLEKTFSSFFKEINLPEGRYIESTRFFVDKIRARTLADSSFPLTKILFMSMINYAKNYNYDGIIGVMSYPMLKIIESSGWHISVLETGFSEKQEPVYLILGHVDEDSRQALKTKILQEKTFLNEKVLNSWPLSEK